MARKKDDEEIGHERSDDPETSAIIYEGATMRQLALMFKMDPKVVMSKVSSLVPVGRRRAKSRNHRNANARNHHHHQARR